MTADPAAELVTVRLLRFPLAVHARAQRHMDELLREFALVAAGRQRQRDVPEDHRQTPERLLTLVDELTRDFSSFTSAAVADREAAFAAGQEEMDLVYRVPPAAALAAQRLDQLLDEADDYCRRGSYLLTLAAPEEIVRLRRWFLEEFGRQLVGEAPLPWPEYAASYDVAAGGA
jgi:hypothetical protein